jgi:hypothetical protein
MIGFPIRANLNRRHFGCQVSGVHLLDFHFGLLLFFNGVPGAGVSICRTSGQTREPTIGGKRFAAKTPMQSTADFVARTTGDLPVVLAALRTTHPLTNHRQLRPNFSAAA